MKKIFYILLPLIISCQVKTNSTKNHLVLPKNGFEFQLFQRKSIKIPSKSDNIICGIDDITGGQTILTIRNNNHIILHKTIEKNQVIDFSLFSQKYYIQCLKLVNILIGEDFGFFIIKNENVKHPQSIDETDKIKTLLFIIEKSDVTFIRNGIEYDSKEASSHLRSKWEQSNRQITTLKSFIDEIASKSSMSQKLYLIKLKNGKIIPAKQWYLEQVKN